MFGFDRSAYLYVISGPMGCGKTEELIRQARRIEEYSKYDYQAFKPTKDTRYSEGFIESRTGDKISATMVRGAQGILTKLDRSVDFVIIDEGQFFNKRLIGIVNTLLRADKKVLLAGLDLDFRGNTFGPMGDLEALADEVDKRHAFCQYTDELGQKCGAVATRTQRLLNGKPALYSDPLVIPGDESESEEMGGGDIRKYCAVCIKHHIVPR
ncbi:thymidine kinase [archaeon]|nr:thymidine kinase [archaeon]